MGAGGDLGVKAIIEAVLDAKGFEEFKKRAQEIKDNAGGTGSSVDGLGKAFSRLQERIPHATFGLLASQMLRTANLGPGMERLTEVLGAGMQVAALSTGALSGALTGATLGLSIILPLIASVTAANAELQKKTDELLASQTAQIPALESLDKLHGGLTVTQARYLQVLKDIRSEQAAKAIQDTKELINQASLNQGWFKASAALQGLAMGYGRAFGAQELANKALEKALKLTPEQQKRLEQLKVILAEQEKAYASGKTTLDEYYKGLLSGASSALDVEKKRLDLENQIRLNELRAAADAATNEEDKAAARARVFDEEVRQRTLALKAEGASATQIARETATARLRFEKQETDIAKKNADERTKKRKEENEAFMAFLLKQTTAEDKAEQARMRAEADADATILKNDIKQERRADVRRKLERKQFERDLDDRVKALKDAGVDEVKIAEFVASEKQRFADEEATTQAMLTAQKMQDAEAILGATSAFLNAAFGKNKASAIAQAIISTAVAIMKAYEFYGPTPVGFAMSALMGATGALQVRQIAQQKGGFDDPLNDQMASSMGRRFAQDFTRLVRDSMAREVGNISGVHAGVMNQTTSTDRSVKIGTLSMPGYFGSPRAALLNFNRALIRVQRLETRTRRR